MKRRPALLRFALALAFGVAGAALFQLWAPRQLELFVELEAPPGLPLPARLDLRITRVEGGAEVVRQRRERLPEARSLVAPVRLPRGSYRLELWGVDAAVTGRWEGTFEVAGEDDVPVRTIRVP